MTSNPEEPRRDQQRDLFPTRRMEYEDQYRSHDRWDRILRFLQRLGQALGGSGPR